MYGFYKGGTQHAGKLTRSQARRPSIQGGPRAGRDDGWRAAHQTQVKLVLCREDEVQNKTHDTARTKSKVTYEGVKGARAHVSATGSSGSMVTQVSGPSLDASACV